MSHDDLVKKHSRTDVISPVQSCDISEWLHHLMTRVAAPNYGGEEHLYGITKDFFLFSIWFLSLFFFPKIREAYVVK